VADFRTFTVKVALLARVTVCCAVSYSLFEIERVNVPDAREENVNFPDASVTTAAPALLPVFTSTSALRTGKLPGTSRTLPERENNCGAGTAGKAGTSPDTVVDPAVDFASVYLTVARTLEAYGSDALSSVEVRVFDVPDPFAGT